MWPPPLVTQNGKHRLHPYGTSAAASWLNSSPHTKHTVLLGFVTIGSMCDLQECSMLPWAVSEKRHKMRALSAEPGWQHLLLGPQRFILCVKRGYRPLVGRDTTHSLRVGAKEIVTHFAGTSSHNTELTETSMVPKLRGSDQNHCSAYRPHKSTKPAPMTSQG